MKKKQTKLKDVQPWVRRLVYLTTMLSFCGFTGLLGAYAMIKKGISEQMGISMSFLGFIDGLSFIGRFIGFIYIIVSPPAKPKRDYFIACTLTSLLLLFIPLCSYFVTYYAQPILMLSLLLSGFFRAYMMVPYLVIIQYYDAIDKDKTAINVWYSVQALGDVFAVIFISIMFNLDWSWQTCFLLNLISFFLTALMMYLAAEEVQMHDQAISERGNSKIVLTEEDNTSSHRSRKSQIFESINFLKNFFLKSASNSLWMLDYSLLSTFYYCILIWFPFYFMKLNLNAYVLWVTIMYPTFIPFGTIAFEYFNNTYSFRRRDISLFFMCSSSAIHILICFIPASDSTFLLFVYIILIACDGMFQGGHFVSVCSWELSMRVKGNREKYSVMSGIRLAYQLMIFVCLFIIGWLMEKDYQYLIYSLAFIASLNTAVLFYRNKKYRILEPGQDIPHSTEYLEMIQY